MQRDEIDRMLGSEEPIVPSSGFAAAVMDAVRQEAAAPEPIEFPWRRAIPGMVAGGIAIGAVIVVGALSLAHPASSLSSPVVAEMTEALTRFVSRPEGMWMAFASVIGAGSVLFGLRVAFPRS